MQFFFFFYAVFKAFVSYSLCAMDSSGHVICEAQCKKKKKCRAPCSKIIKNFKMAEQSTKPSMGPCAIAQITRLQNWPWLRAPGLLLKPKLGDG